MMHKIYRTVAIRLQTHFQVTAQSASTRGANVRFIPIQTGSTSHRRTFMVAAHAMWNGLPAAATVIQDHEAFRSAIAAVRLTA